MLLKSGNCASQDVFSAKKDYIKSEIDCVCFAFLSYNFVSRKKALCDAQLPGFDQTPREEREMNW